MDIVAGGAMLLPLAAGLGQLLLSNRLRRCWITGFLAGTLLLVVLLYSTMPEAVQPLLAGKLNSRMTFLLAPDRMGAFFALVFSGVWLLVAVFAYEYLAVGQHSKSFFVSYCVTLTVLLGQAFAGNLLTFYLFFELMALSSLPFILLSGTREARGASMKYLGYSVFGACLTLLGMALLIRYGGTAAFQAGGLLSETAGGESQLLLIYFVMAIGFGCKAGLLPLQGWLPTAHAAALTPGSAVLSAIVTKCGVLGLIRLSYYVFPPQLLQGSWAQKTLLLLAIGTIFAGSMLAFREVRLKRCLAYSTISQVAYVLLGLFLLTEQGLQGALLQVICHAGAKAALFLCAGILMSGTGLTRRDELGGLGKRFPVVFAVWAVAALSMVGIPPLGGFQSKWLLCLGILDSTLGGFSALAIGMLMLSALLTSGYLFPVVIHGFFPEPEATGLRLDSGTEKAYPQTATVLLLLSAVVILAGIWPGAFIAR